MVICSSIFPSAPVCWFDELLCYFMQVPALVAQLALTDLVDSVAPLKFWLMWACDVCVFTACAQHSRCSRELGTVCRQAPWKGTQWYAWICTCTVVCYSVALMVCWLLVQVFGLSWFCAHLFTRTCVLWGWASIPAFFYDLSGTI